MSILGLTVLLGFSGAGSAAGATQYPSIGAAGITFSASVPTDPQRDVGEPEVHIDRAGRIWTCGPSGFSNIADYAQISTDGGDQFHLLGQPPRGQISGGEGGGDCGLATAPYPNSTGEANYTFAYTGLGPLTNFSTGTSDDAGHTLTVSAVSESPVGVDRQWLVFTDEKTVFLNFNQLATSYTVQKSTDGGLTYGPPIIVGGGNGRIGPLRAILSSDDDPSKAIVYFPSYNSATSRTDITLFRSMDGGTTWDDCVIIDAGFDPSAGFILADHDSAGNIYIAYTAKGVGGDTYMTVVPAGRVASCEGGEKIGTGKQVRVNRDNVETTVMPWIVAGDEGRVAVAFFGTDSIGDADSGAFVASWYPYVNISTDALSSEPHWAQAKSTSHPFHYGSICLNGLACDVPIPDDSGVPKKGDRSLADYFAMDLSPTTGRLHVVYGSSAKKPTDEIGHVSTATVVTQETGPSLLADRSLKARRPALRQSTEDPEGDALAPYSQLFVTPTPTNQPALDVTKVDVGPEVDLETGAKIVDGGMTVTMHLADVGGSALQQALLDTNSRSLVYLFRFMNGFQPAGATAAWNPATGWTFGFDDFTTKGTEAGQADPTSEKIIVWNQKTAIEGKVDPQAGTIKLSVPRNLLRAQAGRTDRGHMPDERPAAAGDRLFDGTVFTLANSFTATQAVQSYLYPVDATATMDFIVGSPANVVVDPGPGRKPRVEGGKRGLPATGVTDTATFGMGLLVLAIAGGLALRRRHA